MESIEPQPTSSKRPYNMDRDIDPEEVMLLGPSEPDVVRLYRESAHSAEVRYQYISPLWRLRLANLDTLVAQAASLVGFAA